jgi:hypothetical protein
MVGDLHRTLLYGGLFLYPEDKKNLSGKPTPYTLHPQPSTLNPTPYTLNPEPYTLHPTPYTPNPTP